MTWRRRSVLAALLVAAPALTRAQGGLAIPARWVAVKVEDNAFTVEMPGIPDHKVLNAGSTAKGQPKIMDAVAGER